MASADFSLRFSTLPFQARGETSPGKKPCLPSTAAESTPPPFGCGGFAVKCLLAPVGTASYSVSVRRLGLSLHASFSVCLAAYRLALRLSFLQPVSSEDFHLQAWFHAGHTFEIERAVCRPFMPASFIIRRTSASG